MSSCVPNLQKVCSQALDQYASIYYHGEISRNNIVGMKYVEYDPLDMGHNYYHVENQRRLSLTFQRLCKCDHGNQTNPEF